MVLLLLPTDVGTSVVEVEADVELEIEERR